MSELFDPKHPGSVHTLDPLMAKAGMLRAGAGRTPIELPVDLFPTEGLSGVHDVLHARLLLLENHNRVALVSVELTSMPEEQIALLRRTVGETAGLPSENVWICVTHTLSAPHFTPKGMCRTAADRHKNSLLWQAVEDAVREAASQAANGLQEARIGHKSGRCDVNVNRDILTAEGWWLGCNETGFSDKTVTVLRIEALDGSPIALLFSHCVRPAVMERRLGAAIGGLVSADLAGAASALVEQEYGGSATALFFMGAAGDQAPSLTGATFQYVGRDGGLRVKDVDEGGLVVVQMIGARLGAEVLRLSEEIDCRPCAEPIVTEGATVEYQGQEMMETHLIRPTKQYAFVGGGSRLERLEIIRVGDVALVGLSPELSCQTGVSIRERSPFPATLVLTMVNGGAKYMAELDAYDRITYEAMNSPFAGGSAEIMIDKSLELLRSLAG
jgi:neutral ceramidase